MQTVKVEIVSDVMCPWCFIGKRRLEAALRELPGGIEVEIAWKPYQLDPTLTKTGKDRRQYLEEKFGGPERARQIYARVEEAGAAEGIPFDFDAIEVSANTLDAHRLIRWAGAIDAQTQDRLVEALFRTYFIEGRNLGDNDVLGDAAAEAGMDRDAVVAKLAGEEDSAEVSAEIALAQRMGVTGVPCFILDGKYAVTGAQEAQFLASAIAQVAAEKTA
jgi:predicted DsbA family dithiol-disulfide isomerase